MNRWTDTQDPKHLTRFIGQRILYGFRKCREIIWRIVVDEDYFVGWFSQNFSNTIETQCCALMKVIAIVVVPSIKDNRNHRIRASKYRTLKEARRMESADRAKLINMRYLDLQRRSRQRKETIFCPMIGMVARLALC